MDLLNGMNRSMDYIEENLSENIDFEVLARTAGCSRQQYTRMFPLITGISLSEYIRRRRLTVAAFELQQNKVTVIEAAIKYGYESPTAFNAAFKKMHGVAPSKSKAKGIALKSYPRLSFNIQIKGDVKMNYSIEEKPAFSIVGIKGKVAYAENENNSIITKMWKDLDEKTKKDLLKISDGFINGLIGVSANSTDSEFDYYIAVTASENKSSDIEGGEIIRIASSSWARFEAVGAAPESIINTFKRIFTEWMPESGYESTNMPCIEVYREEDSNSADYKCEILVPVAKK